MQGKTATGTKAHQHPLRQTTQQVLTQCTNPIRHTEKYITKRAPVAGPKVHTEQISREQRHTIHYWPRQPLGLKFLVNLQLPSEGEASLQPGKLKSYIMLRENHSGSMQLFSRNTVQLITIVRQSVLASQPCSYAFRTMKNIAQWYRYQWTKWIWTLRKQ